MLQDNTPIYCKLEEIASVLAAQPSSADISLTGGDAGRALFLLYYSRLSKKEIYLDKAIGLMDDLLVSITQADCHPWFAGGLAGVGWLLQHAVDNDFLDADVHLLLGEMDEMLFHWMMEEILNGNHDYLYGATGVALYFLSKTAVHKKYAHFVKQFINQLADQAIEEQEMVKWRAFVLQEGMYPPEAGRDIFNLGLSHGIPGIAAFLAKATSHAALAPLSNGLLQKSCRFLQHHMRTPELHGSYFGYLVNGCGQQGAPARLAWCYGDLGVCTTLWQAGAALRQESLKAVALDIARHNATKRDLAAAQVQDACFCHGSSGIAHIYHQLHRQTGEALFREAADFWYGETLAMATFEDGLAGYKTYAGTDPRQGNGEWHNMPGLLEGVAGIGLSLVAAVADFEPAWDEALLLS